MILTYYVSNYYWTGCRHTRDMALLFIMVITMLAAFALFAGESMMRMRSDIKFIRDAVTDMRGRVDQSRTRNDSNGSSNSSINVSMKKKAVVVLPKANMLTTIDRRGVSGLRTQQEHNDEDEGEDEGDYDNDEDITETFHQWHP